MNSFTDEDRTMLLAKSEDGFPVPVLDDAPGLPISLVWAMNGFRDLRSCRPHGMAGLGPIPVTAMIDYFRASGFAPSLWEEAKRYWSELDAIELNFYYKKQAAKMPSFEAKT